MSDAISDHSPASAHDKGRRASRLRLHSPNVWYSITSAASELSRSAARLIRSKSRACTAARSRSSKYLRSTFSMKAERERLDPASLSIFVKTSLDSVIDVFSFILLLYYSSTFCLEIATSFSGGGRSSV